MSKNLDLYEKLIATNPAIKRKGATNPYTSENGHMFTHLDKSGTVGIRLSKEDAEAFVKKYKSKPFETYGVIKKDWVAVPDGLLKKTAELSKYLKLSHDHVKALKPK
jgi:hypothetical protein